MKNFIAAVCLNGHGQNGMLTDTAFDDKYCSECGALIITCCSRCNHPIKGFPHNTILANHAPTPPAYCPECGQPYQWTERKLAQASDLIYEIESLEREERECLVSSFPDLIAETPNTQLTVIRTKRILAKTRGTVAELIKSILINITCEAVKRHLGWS